MKVKQQLTRKYYKYVTVESSWTQPVLSSNGTIGVDDFAVSATDTFDGVAYYPFTSNGAWTGRKGATYIMYSNNALCIRRLGFSGFYDGGPIYIMNFTFYGSNDGNSWTDLGTFSNNTYNFTNFNINNNNFYKYYKILVNSIRAGGAIKNIQLTATQQTVSVVEGTKDDYDFYEDEIALNAFVDNNVYKAMKF